MRRFRGKTWLNFAATLLLAAVISPMADATHAQGMESPPAPFSMVPDIGMAQALIQIGAGAGRLEASNKPTNLLARVDLSSTSAQIPVGLASGVYYDIPQAQSEPGLSAATEKAPLSGILAPGKWMSVLSTVLLVGFLFLRRAS